MAVLGPIVLLVACVVVFAAVRVNGLGPARHEEVPVRAVVQVSMDASTVPVREGGSPAHRDER